MSVDPSRPRSEVVLIGPHRAGKSTLARLLAARLGCTNVSLDRIKWSYFAALGFDAEAGRRFSERKGFLALTRHLKPYAIQTVERVLAEHHDCVFDFGAGHSMYEQPEHVVRIERALAPFRHVMLVLPSPDVEESVRVLKERSGPWVPDGSGATYFEFERYEVEHPSNRMLATLTAYTDGRSPEQTCDDLLGQMRRRSPVM